MHKQHLTLEKNILHSIAWLINKAMNMLSEAEGRSGKRHRRLMHSEWLVHINRCAQEQQGHETYCQQHDLSLKAFKKHFFRHRRHSSVNQTLGEKNFIPVTLTKTADEEGKPYEVLFPRGVLLKIPGKESLASIVKSLRGYL